ncbi:hypothetical protein [Breznakia pachnodae]|uniref:Uncharacterized protein n=1 Tax=Breznakia pachnodae TaxID=265178 RepID=A0ABU0E524_9FIRM|nr:hypothetical protein [Breznakia pachnodae]MDQ0362011.1 hypothetical protein [Breznakia pachnodae]
MENNWINGGPFLEVSFVLETTDNSCETIMGLINSFNSLPISIEVQKNDLQTKLLEFEKGYNYDDNRTIHNLNLNGYIYINKKRKVLIEITRISTALVLVDFIFFGSQFDVEEWNQVGIQKSEYILFYQLLDELFKIYSFKIGCVEIEDNVLSLFDVFVEYPDEQYNIDNLDFNKVKNNHKPLYVKLNEN